MTMVRKAEVSEFSRQIARNTPKSTVAKDSVIRPQSYPNALPVSKEWPEPTSIKMAEQFIREIKTEMARLIKTPCRGSETVIWRVLEVNRLKNIRKEMSLVKHLLVLKKAQENRTSNLMDGECCDPA